MKLGQLIEFNMGNIFLEKSYTKCGGETIPRPFSKKIKIKHISGSIVQSFIQSVSGVYQVEGYLKISTLSYRPLAFTSYKSHIKQNKVCV